MFGENIDRIDFSAPEVRENHDVTKEDLDSAFERASSNEIYQGLIKGKELSEVLNLEVLLKSFEKNAKRILACSDGRVILPMDGYALVKLPGSGVNLSDDDFLKVAKGRNLQGWSRHDDCGAENGKSEDELSVHEQRMENLIGGEGHNFKMDSMTGKVHDELFYVIDASGENFNMEKAGLPAGFLDSSLSLGLASKNVAQNMKTLIDGVAMKHGFAERFSKEKPMIVAAIAKDAEQEVELKTVFENINLHGDKLQFKSINLEKYESRS